MYITLAKNSKTQNYEILKQPTENFREHEVLLKELIKKSGQIKKGKGIKLFDEIKIFFVHRAEVSHKIQV